MELEYNWAVQVESVSLEFICLVEAVRVGGLLNGRMNMQVSAQRRENG